MLTYFHNVAGIMLYSAQQIVIQFLHAEHSAEVRIAKVRRLVEKYLPLGFSFFLEFPEDGLHQKEQSAFAAGLCDLVVEFPELDLQYQGYSECMALMIRLRIIQDKIKPEQVCFIDTARTLTYYEDGQVPVLEQLKPEEDPEVLCCVSGGLDYNLYRAMGMIADYGVRLDPVGWR